MSEEHKYDKEYEYEEEYESEEETDMMGKKEYYLRNIPMKEEDKNIMEDENQTYNCFTTRMRKEFQKKKKRTIKRSRKMSKEIFKKLRAM